MSGRDLWPMLLFCPRCAAGDSGTMPLVVLVPTDSRAVPLRWCETHTDVRMHGAKPMTYLSFPSQEPR